MKLIPLASSSHGNAYLVEDGTTCLLIECGVSWKKLQKLTGFGVSGIAGCLISHEHKDHAGCYEQLIRSGVPVYASRGTAEALGCEQLEPLEDREVVTLGSFDILPFPTFHDAAEPMGFLIRSRTDGDKLVFATDTVNLRSVILGQENTYEMVRVDEPTQEGTPLNKANLLKDPVAKMYGLSELAVPNDVFDFLGKYNLHWWKTSGYIPPYYTLGEKKDHRISGSEVFDTFTIQYANSVSVDDSGVVSLKNPTSATIQCEFGSGDADEINKVPTGSFMMSDRFPNEHAIYYKSADAYDEKRSGASTIGTYLPEQEVAGHPATLNGEGTVHSADRNAYPDNGAIGKTHYKYYGIPFENLVKTAAKIVAGEYVGTGTSGSSNKNSLKFGFKPSMVLITGNGYFGVLTSEVSKYFCAGISGWNSLGKNGLAGSVTFDTNGTVSWYATASVGDYNFRDSPNIQFNAQSVTYSYIAIG